MKLVSATNPCLASALIGPNPPQAVARISLAVRQQLRRYPTAPVAVACSGGGDSLALAVVTIDLAQRSGRACHVFVVDHKMRPESSGEAAAVVALLRQLGADAHVLTAMAQAAPRKISEASARELRYQLLFAAARSLTASPVANVGNTVENPNQKQRSRLPLLLIGHTLDDQAETVLLALARGSGTRSLRGILPERVSGGVRLLRPLLQLRRTDTQACVDALGLRAVADPTNCPDGPWRRADGLAPARVELRHSLLPDLARALGTDPIPALGRTAQLAAVDEEALNTWTQQVYPQLSGKETYTASDPAQAASSELKKPARVTLAIAQLQQLPEAIRTRCYRRAAAELGCTSLTAEHYWQVDQLVTNWHGQGAFTGSGIQIFRDKPGKHGESAMLVLCAQKL